MYFILVSISIYVFDTLLRNGRNNKRTDESFGDEKSETKTGSGQRGVRELESKNTRLSHRI